MSLRCYLFSQIAGWSSGSRCPLQREAHESVLGSNQHHATAQTCPNGCRLRAMREDATRTQNSMFGIRNLRKPRELSQPNQLDMVGERGFEPPTPWPRIKGNL